MCNDFINRYGELTKYVAVILQHLLCFILFLILKRKFCLQWHFLIEIFRICCIIEVFIWEVLRGFNMNFFFTKEHYHRWWSYCSVLLINQGVYYCKQKFSFKRAVNLYQSYSKFQWKHQLVIRCWAITRHLWNLQN